MLAGATGRPRVSHLPPTAVFYFSDAGEGTEAAQRKRGSSRGRSASAYTHASGFHKEQKGLARRETLGGCPGVVLQPSATWQGCAGLLPVSGSSAAASSLPHSNNGSRTRPTSFGCNSSPFLSICFSPRVFSTAGLGLQAENRQSL